jgi:hypothetical protein
MKIFDEDVKRLIKKNTLNLSFSNFKKFSISLLYYSLIDFFMI